MKRGYVRLYRKVLDSAIWADPMLFHLFCFCLLKANHKTSHASLDGVNTPVKVDPGQFITGRYSLHNEYYSRQKRGIRRFSPQTIYRKLKVVEDMQILSIKSNNKFSIITIVNWHTYQNVVSEKEQQNEQQMNNNRTTDEQQMNTSEELINNEENSPKSENSEPDPKESASGSLVSDTKERTPVPQKDNYYTPTSEEFDNFKRNLQLIGKN